MGGVCGGQKVPKKVLMTGPKGSGKTTLLYYWCQNMITEPASTEGFNVETVTSEKFGPLMIWDVTDPTRRRQFYHGTDAIVYMLEYNTKTDFAMVKEEVRSLLKNRDLKNLPVLVVFSKTDLVDMSEDEAEELVSSLEIKSFRAYHCARTRMDYTASYKQALERLHEIIFCDSKF